MDLLLLFNIFLIQFFQLNLRLEIFQLIRISLKNILYLVPMQDGEVITRFEYL